MVPGRRRATQCIAPASSRHESLAEAHRPRSKTDPGHRPRAPASRRVGPAAVPSACASSVSARPSVTASTGSGVTPPVPARSRLQPETRRKSWQARRTARVGRARGGVGHRREVRAERPELCVPRRDRRDQRDRDEPRSRALVGGTTAPPRGKGVVAQLVQEAGSVDAWRPKAGRVSSSAEATAARGRGQPRSPRRPSRTKRPHARASSCRAGDLLLARC